MSDPDDDWPALEPHQSFDGAELVASDDRIRVVLHHDSDCPNPRQACTVGTLWTAGRHQGDEEYGWATDLNALWERGHDLNNIARYLRVFRDVRCALPFGKSGLIFDTPTGREQTGVDPERLPEALVGELEEYRAWLDGDTYGYVLESRDGQTLDSLWGLIAHPYALHEAMRAFVYETTPTHPIHPAA